MKREIYYISQGLTPQEHLSHIKKVCSSGIQLVQLRMKNVADEIYLDTAKKAKDICQKYDASLVVNDNLLVAIQGDADGLHLGKNDMSPRKARQSFGGFIGGTANTLQDCVELIEAGVDYIGLGPFRYTETKQNLSPVLGLQGVLGIVEELNHTNTPIYVIGGIVQNDFSGLFSSSIHGIAVSGMLTRMKEDEIKKILEKLKKQG